MNTLALFSLSDVDASRGMLHSGLKIYIGKSIFVFLCKNMKINFSNTDANILLWTLTQSVYQACVSLAGGGVEKFMM